MISIVVASRLDTFLLKRLFASLQKQTFKRFELLICATNPRRKDQPLIQKLAPDLHLRILSTPNVCIASARNKGIQQAKGSVVLFLDEDCFLPRKTYLSQLFQFHRKHPTFAAGGFYRSTQRSLKSDQFYNFVCNSWVVSRQNLKRSPPVLLGGCCFYPLQLLKKNQLFFDEKNSRAGEEYLLNASWSQLGLPLLLSHRWSVFHQPETTYVQVFRKAWRQGAQLHSQKAGLPFEQIKNALRFLYQEKETKLRYLPMLGLYSAIGRASFLKQTASAYYSRNILPLRKTRVLPPSVLQSAKTGPPFAVRKSSAYKILNKQQPTLKTKSSKSQNLIKTSAKIKAAKPIYKN